MKFYLQALNHKKRKGIFNTLLFQTAGFLSRHVTRTENLLLHFHITKKNTIAYRAYRVFVDLLVAGVEVVDARLNVARPPEPTDIPLRAWNRHFGKLIGKTCKNMI